MAYDTVQSLLFVVMSLDSHHRMEVDLRRGHRELLRMTKYLWLLHYIELPVHQPSTVNCDKKAEERSVVDNTKEV